MADLDITMGNEVAEVEAPPPTDDDKRAIDNLKHRPAIKEVVEPVVDEPELEVKPVIKDEVIFGSEEAEDEPPSPIKKQKKPPSEKQRAHLKRAREKALATRRANSAGRKAVEEEKKLARQKKREERDKLMLDKEEKEHKKANDIPESVPPPKFLPLQSLSQE